MPSGRWAGYALPLQSSYSLQGHLRPLAGKGRIGDGREVKAPRVVRNTAPVEGEPVGIAIELHTEADP